MESAYEVVIVGAGPGGALCALNCAKQGLKTAVLDRKPVMGMPVRCAEGVTTFHLNKFFPINQKYIRSMVNGVRFFAPSGGSIEISLPGGGVILKKSIFLQDILDKAVSAGAHVFTNCRVIGLYRVKENVTGVRVLYKDRKVRINANVTVGADGVESRLGRWAGLDTANRPTEIEPCYQYIVENGYPDKAYIELYADNELAPGGYFWNFPHSMNQSNIGVVLRGAYSKRRSAREVLDIFLERRFKAVKIKRGNGGAIPGGHTLPDLVCGGFMLVGDAAHQVNPLSRAGILEAMRAGAMAAEIIADAIRCKDTSRRKLGEYKKLWNKLLGDRHKMLFKVKKAITGFDNAIFDKTLDSIKKIDKNDISVATVIKQLILNKPSVLVAARHFI